MIIADHFERNLLGDWVGFKSLWRGSEHVPRVLVKNQDYCKSAVMVIFPASVVAIAALLIILLELVFDILVYSGLLFLSHRTHAKPFRHALHSGRIVSIVI